MEYCGGRKGGSAGASDQDRSRVTVSPQIIPPVLPTHSLCIGAGSSPTDRAGFSSAARRPSPGGPAMDFHAAMETFAEAWVAANTQTAVNSGDPQQTMRPTPLEDLPTMLTKDQLAEQRHKSGTPESSSRPSSSHKPSAAPVPSATSGKSIPIHCIVEQAASPQVQAHEGRSLKPVVELDSYAIIPSSTLFSEIIRTALAKLGYNTTEAMGAKGAIQIKNWKPLTFDTITENPESTVEEILGDMTSIATLRIKLCSQSKLNATDEVKEKLLQLLLQHSQGLLVSLGCPIEKPTLSLISKGEYPNRISDETRLAFNKWYHEQLKNTDPSTPSSKRPKDESRSETVSTSVTPTFPGRINPSLTSLISKTRIRTSFDPDHEIPRLHAWFQQNQHPSREQMNMFLHELNSLESRKGRKPLDLTNIIYWFKNARAAQRRATKSLSSEEMMVDNDENDNDHDHENLDGRLSPCSTEVVPLLPNRNAVYVVSNPMHHPEVERAAMLMVNDVASAQEEGKSSEVFTHTQDSENDSSHDDEVPAENQNGQQTGSHGNGIHSQENQTNGSNGRERSNSRDTIDSRSDMNSDSTPNGDSCGDVDMVSVKQEKENDHEYPPSLPATPSPQPQPLPAHIGHHLASPLNLAYMHPAVRHPLYRQLEANPLLANHHHQFKEMHMSMSSEERKKRSRVFIDPLTEIPKLEKWFQEDTHPSSYMIEKYTEDLNRSEYRQRFPKLEPKNVQLWFKNHRAKVKRARLDPSAQLALDMSPLST